MQMTIDHASSLVLFAQCLTQGDSGGPLTAMEGDAHVLIGIVSKKHPGTTCSDQEQPAVFTSVSALLPWVEEAIKENGGMISCGFKVTAAPTLGIIHLKSV